VNNIVASNLKNKDGWFWFLRPQVDFILDKNQQLLVNEIFKIENLSDGIATIIERSGLSGQQLLHVNQSSQLGLSSRMLRATKLAIKEKLPLSAILDRNSKACDQQTKSRIEQLYAADYEYLGY
jgi:hypothetical protein